VIITKELKPALAFNWFEKLQFRLMAKAFSVVIFCTRQAKAKRKNKYQYGN